MAINKGSDPVSDKAIQALEEALAIDFNLETAPSEATRLARAPVKIGRPADETVKTSTPEPSSRAQFHRPANDPGMRASTSILRSMEMRQSHGSTRVAAVLSVIWFLSGLGVAHVFYAPEIWQIRSIENLAAIPGALAILIGVIFPILLFFAFAIMIVRAQELRQAARAMAEVALKLAEPESAASDRIMSIGQAVRREVSAMNEGIERTIARATELETLVHSEVNSLERSYSDNEMRVRTLVQELGTEREAIISHAERIRSSISGAHDQLKDELSLASSNISLQITTSGDAVARLIDTQAAMLLEKSDNAGQSIGSLLANKTDILVSALASSSISLAHEFDARLTALTSTLAEHGRDLLSEFEARASNVDNNTEKLNAALLERTRQLNETLIARTREFNESLGIGQQAISFGLDEVIAVLNASLDEKGASFRQSLKASADDAIMDMDLRVGFFDEKFHSAVGQVSSIFDHQVGEFTDAFDRRAGSLDGKLAESLANINSSLASGKDALDGILSSSIDRLASSFTDQSLVMESVIAIGQQSIDDVLGNKVNAITDAISSVNDKIESGFGGAAGNLVSALASKSEFISNAVNDGYGELKRLLDEKSSAIEKAFSDNHARLDNAMVRGSELIIGNVDDAQSRLSRGLGETAIKMALTLNEGQRDFEGLLTERTEALSSAIAKGSSAFDASTTGVSEQLRHALSASNEEIKATLEQGRRQIDHTLSEQATNLGTSVAINASMLEMSLEDAQVALKAVMENTVGKLEQAIEQSSMAVDESARRFAETIDARQSAMRETIDTGLGLVDARLQSAASLLSSRFDEGAEAFEQRAKIFSDKIETQEQALRKTIDTSADAMDERIQAGAATLVSSTMMLDMTLESRQEAFKTTIVASAANLDQTIRDSASGIAIHLGETVGEISRAADMFGQRMENTLVGMTDRFDNTGNRIETSLSGLEGRFKDDIERIADRVDEAGNKLSSSLDGHLGSIEAASDFAATRLTQALEARSVTMKERLGHMEERFTTMDRALTIGLDNVSRTIEGKAVELASALHNAVTDAAGAMDINALKASHLLSRSSAEFASTLADKGEEFNRAIRESADAVTLRLGEAETRMTGQAQALKDGLTEAEIALDVRSTSIRSVLDERTRELNSMLASRSAELSKIIDEQARPVIKDLSSIGRNVSEQIGEATRQGTDRLKAENVAFVQSVSARTEETLAVIAARSDDAARTIHAVETSLTDNVMGLIERLDASSSAIDQIVERAADNLGSVDQSLGQTTARFSDTASRVFDIVSTSTRLLEGKVDKLVEVSSGTLNEIAGIVGRFDDHSKVLGQASNLLAAAQSNLVTTLEEREEALQILAIGLVSRSEDIEGTMRSLVAIVDTAFERAEQRSGEVSANLKEGIQSSFSEIGKMLGETERRTSQTAEAMRSAVARASDEASNTAENAIDNSEKRAKDVVARLASSVSTSLDGLETQLGETGKRTTEAAGQLRQILKNAAEDALSRFAGATEEIRRSASDIRKELEETRDDLRRGAFDLPDEAKESAGAMRRAVSEQIKALQELSSIIGQSQSSFEVSTPLQTKTARTPAPQPAAIPPQGSVTSNQNRMAPGPARSQPPTHLAPTATPQARQSVSREPTRPVMPRVSERDEPLLTDENSGGWISNLLRGASIDEPTAKPKLSDPQHGNKADSRNPHHVVESLNSLSVDIARAIDHDASVELWRRYQRGERDVFTRRLYTIKGQQTFDEIQRKYDREPEFRMAVDRYIGDFEKLLADVARNDGDKALTQTYLTSDTGKVYTMLAHAAGRFS